MNNISLHKFWWLWIPVIGIVLQVILELSLPIGVRKALHSEWGRMKHYNFSLL